MSVSALEPSALPPGMVCTDKAECKHRIVAKEKGGDIGSIAETDHPLDSRE